MLSFITNIVSEQILIPALNAVTLAAIGFAGAWLRRKLHGEKMANIIQHLGVIEGIAKMTVLSLNQTIVDELKKGGGWNKDKAQELKNRAINEVVRQIKPSVQKLITKAGIDLSNYVANVIESAVREDKRQ